jgi:hypothetical protein
VRAVAGVELSVTPFAFLHQFELGARVRSFAAAIGGDQCGHLVTLW